jgi:hypothetical protein
MLTTTAALLPRRISFLVRYTSGGLDSGSLVREGRYRYGIN